MRTLQLLSRILTERGIINTHPTPNIIKLAHNSVMAEDPLAHIMWSQTITQPTPTTIQITRITYTYSFAVGRISRGGFGSSAVRSPEGTLPRVIPKEITETHIPLADPDLLDKVEELCKSSNSSQESSQNNTA